MPYVIADDVPDEPAGVRFRRLLDRPEILQMPGAHLGIAALLAKKEGFKALYMSGAAMSATMGMLPPPRVKSGFAPHPFSYARAAACITGLSNGNSAGLPTFSSFTPTFTVGGVIDLMYDSSSL